MEKLAKEIETLKFYIVILIIEWITFIGMKMLSTIPMTVAFFVFGFLTFKAAEKSGQIGPRGNSLDSSMMAGLGFLSSAITTISGIFVLLDNKIPKGFWILPFITVLVIILLGFFRGKILRQKSPQNKG